MSFKEWFFKEKKLVFTVQLGHSGIIQRTPE